MVSALTAYRADWIFPVCGPPIRDGVLEITADGRIAAIRTGRDRDAVDFGECAVVPGLVNAHVHLEFSDLVRPLGPARPFSQWVRNVVAHRRQRLDSTEAIVRRGLNELAISGTAAAGEIATSDGIDAYASGAVDVTIFRELIGPLPEQWPALLAAAERHVAGQPAAPGLRHGLSPHATYTVPQELFERAVDLSVRYDASIAVHLAETAAERELLADGTGELVELMRSLDLWRDELHPRGRRPLDWLRRLAETPQGLVIHGNYLDDDELEFLAGSTLSLVYCPRTHSYFEHPPHPFRRVIELGGRVALGTDGRSSNPDLDLWQEAVFLRQRHADLGCDTILDLITSSGAAALGIADRCGVLDVGRRADFLVVRLAAVGGTEPPDLFADGNAVSQVFRAGIAVDRPSTDSLRRIR
ncbi:MAG: amidohydrolase family protein [Planctomycetaceae bacterium]